MRIGPLIRGATFICSMLDGTGKVCGLNVWPSGAESSSAEQTGGKEGRCAGGVGKKRFGQLLHETTDSFPDLSGMGNGK